jgi:hypothetical protein
MIRNVQQVLDRVKQEKLDICVISYGGSCSNQLEQQLSANGYNVKTPIWAEILCHCPLRIDLPIPIIYIYDNPVKAFLSMKRRGWSIWGVNQAKLSNSGSYAIQTSDENLLRLMINHFKLWTSPRSPNVLILKSSELFEEPIVAKLQTFLQLQHQQKRLTGTGQQLTGFPIPYVPPKTLSTTRVSARLAQLFSKYAVAIQAINTATF